MSFSLVAPLNSLPLVTICLVLGRLNWTPRHGLTNAEEREEILSTCTWDWDAAIFYHNRGTHHQSIPQDSSAPTETALSRMWLPALLALLTCPELVVGAALQHLATVMGTAGETLLSPPAWDKAPGSGHHLLWFLSQLPGALDTFLLLCQVRNCPGIWDLLRSLLRRDSRAWLMSKHPLFMCATVFRRQLCD